MKPLCTAHICDADNPMTCLEGGSEIQDAVLGKVNHKVMVPLPPGLMELAAYGEISHLVQDSKGLKLKS